MKRKLKYEYSLYTNTLKSRKCKNSENFSYLNKTFMYTEMNAGDNFK